jgi:hypothetical protein
MYINTNINPSKKNTLKVTYKAEYTNKDEDINNDFSNLIPINGITDLEGLMKIMFTLRQEGKYNINIGYIIEDNDQWIVEDYSNMTEEYKDTNLEIKQSKQITEQQEYIKELTQKLEQHERFIKKYNAEKEFKKFQKEQLFWYELLFRGISPGCQPKDFIECDHSKGKFGIVAYNRQLTEKELNQYEMKEYNN